MFPAGTAASCQSAGTPPTGFRRRTAASAIDSHGLWIPRPARRALSGRVALVTGVSGRARASAGRSRTGWARRALPWSATGWRPHDARDGVGRGAAGRRARARGATRSRSTTSGTPPCPVPWSTPSSTAAPSTSRGRARSQLDPAARRRHRAELDRCWAVNVRSIVLLAQRFASPPRPGPCRRADGLVHQRPAPGADGRRDRLRGHQGCAPPDGPVDRRRAHRPGDRRQLHQPGAGRHRLGPRGHPRRRGPHVPIGPLDDAGGDRGRRRAARTRPGGAESRARSSTRRPASAAGPRSTSEGHGSTAGEGSTDGRSNSGNSSGWMKASMAAIPSSSIVRTWMPNAWCSPGHWAGRSRYWASAGDPLARHGDEPGAPAHHALPVPPAGDVGRALQPQRARRHRQRGVLTEQADELLHVVALEGVDVAGEERPLGLGDLARPRPRRRCRRPSIGGPPSWPGRAAAST